MRKYRKKDSIEGKNVPMLAYDAITNKGSATKKHTISSTQGTHYTTK